MGTETPQRPRKEAAGSRHEPGLVRQTAPASTDPIGPQTQTLLEEGLRRENLRTALKRVQSNKGAPGVDGMRVEDLPAYLRTEWHAIREQLLDASYIPSPVREVRLPKPGGGTRMLGITDMCGRRAGERLMESLTRFLEGRMRLKVNRTKSAVDRPWKRTFLGYTVTTHFSPRKPAPASLTRAKSDPPHHARGTGTKHPYPTR